MMQSVTSSARGKGNPLALAALLAAFSLSALAQAPADLPSAPTPAPGVSDVIVERALPGALPLSLDEAINRGFQKNLQMELSLANERRVHGEVQTVKNALMPSITAEASTGTREINLAALGFKPALLAEFGLPNFNPIVKVDITSAQINLDQQLFNVPAYYLYRSAQKATSAANYATLNARGGVVLSVATTYLRALADSAQIENANALVKSDEVELQQAKDSHDAGVGTNLDVLRAAVQLQQQQQVLITDENNFEKDKIALNRLIGLPADQQITLTDPVPYENLAEMPLQQALDLAYARRKDYLQLQAELETAERSQKAVRYEYAPTVSVGGFYGVIGETHGLYHGNFTARGQVNIPIFHEAQFRGEREVAAAQRMGLEQQIASLKVTIDEQIREAMLDVESSHELVNVARSNVDLAHQVVDDATERFKAGVDDNLAVVRAEATLAGAQTRLVQTLYQYNAAKLTLARNTGVVETRYREFLGR